MSLYQESIHFLQPVAYYSMDLTHFSMEEPHSHPRCEIMYVRSGKCTVMADGKSFELSHGQYIFLDEDVSHGLWIDNPRGCSIMNIEFACQASQGIARLDSVKNGSARFREFLRKKRRYFIADGREILGYVLTDLIFQLERPQRDLFLVENLMQRLLCELADAEELLKNAGGAAYVRRAAAKLQAEFAGEWTVEKIAAYAGVNRSYLQALFKKEFGCGVMAYLNRLRIQKACFLLANTRMRLSDVAAEIGFNSRQNFALSFEKQMGMPPSRFRQAAGSGFQVDTRSFKQFAP